MKGKVGIVATLMMFVAVASASGQSSVSGLSMKTRTVEPERPAEAEASNRIVDLIAEYLDPTKSVEDRAKMLEGIRGLRTVEEPRVASALASARNLLRAKLKECKEAGKKNCTDRDTLLGQYQALKEESPISLAVPAGATASLGKDKTASAGPVIGFQAWRPDDFFAGAFFTFDTAEALNGDGRSAGEFLRNPPASGTSFYAATSKMFWAINRDSAVNWWTKAHADDGHQLGFIGGAFRVGLTNATVHRKSGDETISKDAFVLHFTPAALITSRTFRDSTNGEYQFGMELGWAFRWIGGDAAQDKEFLAADDVLGSDDTWRKGFDGTFFVRLNAFQPFVRLTVFGRSDEEHLSGFSGPQAFFGVSVQSSLFQTARGRQD